MEKKNVSYIEANFVVNSPVNFIPPKGSETIVIVRLVPTSNESTCNYEVVANNGKPAAIYMVKGMNAVLPFEKVRGHFVESVITALNNYGIRAIKTTEHSIVNGVSDKKINVIQLPYVSGSEEFFVVLQKSMKDIDENGNVVIKTKSDSFTESGVDSRGNVEFNLMQGKVVTRDYIQALRTEDENLVKRLIKSSNEVVESANITNIYSKITSTIPESVDDLI